MKRLELGNGYFATVHRDRLIIENEVIVGSLFLSDEMFAKLARFVDENLGKDENDV